MSLRGIYLNLVPSLGNQSSSLAILVSLASLIFLSACGYNNNGSPGIKCPGATGSYNNSSLGPAGTQWVYELSGWFVNSSNTYTPYTEVGVFTVNGNGRITGGYDDYFVSTSVSGTYSIISNGTGTLNLSITNSTGTQPLVFGITLANPLPTTSVGSFALIEGDSFANASGAAYQQNAATLTSLPSGTFVFRNHVLTSGSSISGAKDSVGLINFVPGASPVNGGTVTVSDDFGNSGAFGQSTNVSGTFSGNGPTAGSGSLTFTDGLGLQTYDYFVIDANDLILYEIDNTNVTLGLGRAEAQQVPGGGFTNASFSGNFAFGSHGDTAASAASGINSVGQFATDGNGTITGGAWDFVRDGSPQLGLALGSGAYTVSSNGRISAALAGGTAAIYLVSPARAFFMITSDATRVEDGTIDQQSTTSFDNGSFSGQYAFVMGGSVSAIPLDRTGTAQADGNGNLGWAEQVNNGGTGNGVCLAGTYSATANGRVTASVSTLSSNLVFYLISPNAGYVLQGDSGAQMFGGMVNQNQPLPVVPGTF